MINYNNKILEIQNALNKKLSIKRYQHTLGVSYTAGCLAMKYGIDVNKAILAGLLHDCAKYMDGEEMLKKAKKFDIDISDAESFKPDLLHAKLGAYYAKNKYNINDEDILSSIRWHTTGKPDMSLFEKIIYISDYIEPSRDKMPRLELIRNTAFNNIDDCLKMILED
ncbi:MAG: bis(5'-nucleosyl)-tetraphosphatase (symmetrical) YqeK, partial [Lachnospiraceae bacterium]|nr:bis(5'-nucleosyl)-tetraphosphatase (symmetrical) YqeK [Lachnospiraceae bacterium]